MALILAAGGAARLRGGLARLRRAGHGRRVHRRQDPIRRLRHHVDERRRQHRLLRRALVPDARAGLLLDDPVPSGDVTAAIWYSFGSPGFDASMFPGSWYDGGGWDDAKYAAASHVLIAYAYSGSESAATHGTSAEFASWAKSELIGGTFAKMKADAGKVSAGFEAFCVRTGGGSQTLVSFSWSTGGVKVAKADSEAGAEPRATPRSTARASPS